MRLVVIGNYRKALTFNVVKALNLSNHSLEHVVLKKRTIQPKSFKKRLKKKIAHFFLRSRYRIIFKKGIMDLTSVEKYCKQNFIPYLLTEDLNSKEVEQVISNLNPDVIILSGSSIIKENIFTLSRLYTINIHRSLLPKYAGLSALFWALYFDEEVAGATVHVVEKKVDSGSIVVQTQKVIEPTDNVASLTRWYYSVAGELILEALTIISDPNHRLLPQDISQRTYFKRPTAKQISELEEKLRKRKNKYYSKN